MSALRPFERTKGADVGVADGAVCPVCGRAVADGQLVTRREGADSPWIHAACRVVDPKAHQRRPLDAPWGQAS